MNYIKIDLNNLEELPIGVRVMVFDRQRATYVNRGIFKKIKRSYYFKDDLKRIYKITTRFIEYGIL